MTDDEFARRIADMTHTLFRVCYAQLRQDYDREDAVQEALRKAWQKRYTLRDERYLQTWIIRILINECHTIQRRNRRLQPQETLPERAALQPMDGTPLHDALLALDEKYRMPIVLHYMEGYSVADVAAALRIPQGTVKTRLKKGREELRKILNEQKGRYMDRETIR